MNAILKALPTTLIFAWLLGSAAAAEPRSFTVGVVPQFEVNTLHAVWRPILDLVEQQTGYKFRLRGATTIPAFERELRKGAFDFAYMNPYDLVMTQQSAAYVPMVRDQEQPLAGVLVVRKDSAITRPEELDGREIAFPAPNALGASMQMRQELTDDFRVTVKPRYVQTHDSVYLNVLLGESDAGGGVRKTLDQQPPQYRESLRVIHTTRPVAPHPFCALPAISTEVREAVAGALLRIAETDEGKQLLARVPINRIGRATLDDYRPLLDMGLDRFFVEQ
ncbi:MAG: phosphate/phosphite/phosphonate ABC transporter substrate-binding protein [Gammaproteobacteria bacterium]|nr:phosphate/phosphite/phosphonate ABC transporter substrate-binding protein [Gammaproteobacteria bacterium]